MAENDHRIFPAGFEQYEILRKKVIDVHTHLACTSAEKNGCRILPAFLKHWKYSVYIDAFGLSKEEAQSPDADDLIADRLSDLVAQSEFLSKAVVLALDGYYHLDGTLDLERTQVLVPNSYVLKQVRRPRNLLYAASVPPYRTDALTELENAKRDGAIFIKWIPSIMGIDPAAENEKMSAFYSKLIELDLTLITHVGTEHSFLFAENDLCDPSRLEKPLKMGVKIVAAHMGTAGKFKGESALKRTKEILRKYPQLKFDISALELVNKFNHVRHALEFPGRFYYGSDYPLINVRLLRFPLSSYKYYYLHLSREWLDFIQSFKNPFDQNLALKLGLGVTVEDMLRSSEL